jgi:hypothetical protein
MNDHFLTLFIKSEPSRCHKKALLNPAAMRKDSPSLLSCISRISVLARRHD